MVARLAVPATLALLALFAPGCGGGPAKEPVTPVPLAAPPAEEAEPTEDVSFLDVMSGQPTEIKIDGKPAGKTPITGYKVPPGEHEVTFVFSEDNAQTLTVTTLPNKGATVKLDPAPPATGTMRGDEVKPGGGEATPPKKKKGKKPE
jgi:hypothetical protein